MEHFALPLASGDRRRAIALMESGEPVGIAQVSLHPDEKLDLVWGVDPYGVDCIAANAVGDGPLDYVSALTWAERQSAPPPQQRHPAEFCW